MTRPGWPTYYNGSEPQSGVAAARGSTSSRGPTHRVNRRHEQISVGTIWREPVPSRSDRTACLYSRLSWNVSQSLSELLPNSQPSHVNCSVVWEQGIADSLLANLPSQLSSLSEECGVTVDNITSHTDSSSPRREEWQEDEPVIDNCLPRLKSQPAAGERNRKREKECAK